MNNICVKLYRPRNVISGPGLIRYIESKDRPGILVTDVPMIVPAVAASIYSVDRI